MAPWGGRCRSSAAILSRECVSARSATALSASAAWVGLPRRYTSTVVSAVWSPAGSVPGQHRRRRAAPVEDSGCASKGTSQARIASGADASIRLVQASSISERQPGYLRSAMAVGLSGTPQSLLQRALSGLSPEPRRYTEGLDGGSFWHGGTCPKHVRARVSSPCNSASTPAGHAPAVHEHSGHAATPQAGLLPCTRDDSRIGLAHWRRRGGEPATVQPEVGALFRCSSQTQSQGQRCIGQGAMRLVVREPGQSLEESQHLSWMAAPRYGGGEFQGCEQAGAAQPIAPLGVVPDAHRRRVAFRLSSWQARAAWR